MKLISLSPFVSIILTPVLVIAPLWGQSAVAQQDSSASSSLVQGLQLRLVESDGPQSTISSKAAKGFTVEVKDSAGNAVPDAAVAFRLPDTGASGTFADGRRSAVSYTDSLGRAHVSGLQWSATPGPMAIRITATKGTAHAGILIDKTLTTEPLTKTITAVQTSPPSFPAPIPGVVVTKTSSADAQQPGTLAKPSGALAPVPAQEPAVSVTGGLPQAKSNSSKKKWIIIAAIVAGAGAGAAMALGKGKSNPSTPASPGISIGTPTISVGH